MLNIIFTAIIKISLSAANITFIQNYIVFYHTIQIFAICKHLIHFVYFDYDIMMLL